MKKFKFTSSAVAISMIISIVFFAVGCNSKSGNSARIVKAAYASNEGGTSDDESRKPLQVKFMIDGLPYRLPKSVLISFSRPVVPAEMAGQDAGSDTIINFSPKLEGSISWESASMLIFKPKYILPFNTSFNVELLQVETEKSAIKPQKSGDWSSSFKTPPFIARAAGIDRLDLEKNETDIVILFSGPASSGTSPNLFSVSISGKSVSGFRVLGQPYSDRLMVRIKSPLIKEGKLLKIKALKGIKAESGQTYTQQAFEESLEIKKTIKKLNFSSIYLEEGPGGFYIEAYCSDYGEALYWSKCDVPQESLKQMVTVFPPANVRFIPQQRGFRALGDFKQGRYRMTIEAGLKSNIGSILLETKTNTFDVPARTPSATFGSKGRFLPRQRLTMVPIKHINVGEVEIKVRRIPEQNIIFWLSGETEGADDRNSDIVFSEKVKLDYKEDVPATSWLDLSKMLPADARGVFEFSVNTPDQSDAVRLVLTNISLVAKRSGLNGENLMIWALDSEKLTPISGAAIELMSMSNRQLAKAATNADGLAEFNGVMDSIDNKPKSPFAVIARTAADFTALKFSDLEVGLSEYPVQGAPYESQSIYRSAIYMDRGVYRPGEKSHLVTIVWDKNDRAPKESLPAVGILVDPRGKEIERQKGETNESGMINFDFKFQDFASTGKYNFYLEVGADRIGQHSFLVEEFVPQRMKVELKPSMPEVLMTDAAEFQVNARYLFGSPARGERMEAVCMIEEGKFNPPQYPGYSFGVWRPKEIQAIPVGRAEAALDDNGAGKFSCPPIGDTAFFKGPGKLTVTANVFESGSGRTTSARISVPAHPDKFYIGLKGSSSKAERNKQVNLEGAVVDWKGNTYNDLKSVKVELYEVQADWIWEYDSNSDQNTWRSYSREVLISEKYADVSGGKFKYSFMPAGYSAGYIVRASSGARVQADLYVASGDYYWWSYDYSSDYDRTPKPASPEGLIIEAPEVIRMSDAANVTIKIPYPGRLLFTLETDRVIESKWYDVKGDKFTKEIKLSKFAPNVYVSALLLKDPFSESGKAFIPGRAFGVQSIKVIPEQHEIKVDISAPKEVKPNEEMTVELAADVKAGAGPMCATVAVVDEGILQLTNYKNPDPLGTFFQKRALGVQTFETIGWTLLLPSMFEEDNPGGDGAADKSLEMETGGAGGRVHAIKPVSIWSGIVKLGADGKGRVKFRIPTYRGELRVVAVVANGERVGVASAQVTVRDPIVIQPSFPRFAMTGDTFVLPVFVTNLSGSKQNIEVELKTNEAIQIKSAPTKAIVLENEKADTVTFVCFVAGAGEAAEFNVKAKASNHVSLDDARIPILPNAPFTNEAAMIKLAPGENDLTSSLAGWTPQYERTTVSVIPNRYARELGHLKYLVHYPYGCIEQTTSTTRPLLYISNLVPSLDPDILKDGTVEEKFMFGVKRLFSMQTADGGFSYWPGEDVATYWGTAYVTDLLLDGVKAGYPISKNRVDEAVKFMEDTISNNSENVDEKYGYSAAESEPYMQYVLAKAGKAQPARVRRLLKDKRANWAELAEENTYLLKAALYLAGDRTYEKDLKSAPFAVTDKRLNNWSFWSALRTRGMMLNIMEDLFPGSKEAEPLAGAIAERLRSASGYYTTQELSWCVSGLGKRASGGAKDWSESSLTLAGKKIDALPPPQKASEKWSVWQVSGASGGKKLALNVDKIEGGDLFALVQVEGIKPGVPYKTGDFSIQARRRYLTQDGQPIGKANIKLGELVFVELTLTNLTDQMIRNVVLIDRFAAGFDVENPRLDKEYAADWINASALWNTTYVNMRDDHIEIFGNLEPKQKAVVVYVLRAVVGGKYITPPVGAEAMYDPRISSQQLGEPVRIVEPWGALTD